MNSTNHKILTLLHHGNFNLKDISLYLDIEISSLMKNITQLNGILDDLRFNKMEFINNKYQLQLEPNQWKYLLFDKDNMCMEDIIDYLYIKFIYKSFINLETEKNEFKISRSSINRYFDAVKKVIVDNGSSFKYEHTKGIKLEYLSEKNKHLFCKKLIKIIIKYDFIIPENSIYFTLFKPLNIELLLKKLYEIFNYAEIPATNFLLAFSFILNICVDIFDGLMFNNKYNKYKKYTPLKEKINLHCSEYSEQFREQFFTLLVNLKNNEYFFEKQITEYSYTLLNEIKKNFKIENFEEDLENILFKKICISLFKYENNILNVYSFRLDYYDKKLLYFIENILLKLHLNIYFYDKIIIINLIKKIIINTNKIHIKKILLVFNEIVLTENSPIKEKIQRQLPDLKIDILPLFHLYFNYSKCIEEYDLIISNENFHDLNIKNILSFDYLKILKKIDETSLKIGLDKCN